MTAFSINQDAINTQQFDTYIFKLWDRKTKAAAAISAIGATSIAGQAMATGGAAGDAGAAAKASVEAGVTNAVAMIQSIDGIALAAFGVALAPFGFMLALRILNMVLSRV